MTRFGYILFTLLFTRQWQFGNKELNAAYTDLYIVSHQHISTVIKVSLKHESSFNSVVLNILTKVLRSLLFYRMPQTNTLFHNQPLKKKKLTSKTRKQLDPYSWGNPEQCQEIRLPAMALHNTWQVLPDFLNKEITISSLFPRYTFQCQLQHNLHTSPLSKTRDFRYIVQIILFKLLNLF